MSGLRDAGPVPSDVAQLQELLDSLDSIWREVGIEYPPGLSHDVIDRECAALPFTLADEVRAWFAWHEIPRRREPPWDETHIGASFMCFLSLDEALEEWWFRCRRSATEAVEFQCTRAEAGWDPLWFPIMRDISGGVVGVDCSVAPGVAAPIYVIHKGDAPDVVVDFWSLNDLVEGWVSLYRAGIYEWRDGAWSSDNADDPSHPGFFDFNKVPRTMKDVF